MSDVSRFVTKAACKLGLGPVLLRGQRSRSPVILMYHGVTDLPASERLDWSGKHVDVDLFREQVSMLARARRIVSLDDLVETLISDGDASGWLAITFDDGYLNNAVTAARVLSELGVPATFFLATGFIGERRWLWNDQIEVVMHRTLRLDTGISLVEETVSLADVASRRRALQIVKGKLKQRPWHVAEKIVREIAETLDVDIGVPHGLHEFMSWDHAKRLHSAGFGVGAHTVNHAILSQVELQEAAVEITQSRDRIVDALGDCCATFCYPNGKRSDYTPEVTSFCAGQFRAALSAEFGAARRTELHELRRVAVDGTTDRRLLSSMILEAC